MANIVDISHDTDFICQNTGVLFEDSYIKITLGAEFKEIFGSLAILYENKTWDSFFQLHTQLSWTEKEQRKLAVTMKPVQFARLGAGVQTQQMIYAECISDYSDAPRMEVLFLHNGVQRGVILKLPLAINKFCERRNVLRFERMCDLMVPQAPTWYQRTLNICMAQQQENLTEFRAKLHNFGMMILDDMTQDENNVVCVALVHMRTERVPCMVNMKLDKSSWMCRITLSTSNKHTLQRIFELMMEFL